MNLDLDVVLSALAPPGIALPDARRRVPPVPGLYAIYGGPDTWKMLGLGGPPDQRPLYVGKAEDSLVARDLDTHFGNGRTGSSTVRRSFAALLHETLHLHARPRNPLKPERFANYGLSPDDDARLTDWMWRELRIAVWPRVGDTPLERTEGAVLQHWLPPLNLARVQTPWTAQVKAARAMMAAEARDAAT